MVASDGNSSALIYSFLFLSLIVLILSYSLIMRLSKTEDPAVQSEILEGLEVCFRFFSILSPYWKDTDEKARVLRDLLSSHVNKNKQHGSDNNEEDEDDQDHEDGDDDDDEGDNESGGGGVEDDKGTITARAMMVVRSRACRIS